MSIDKHVESCLISYTEKDSPYYGKNYDSLMDSQKRIHNLYVERKVFLKTSEKILEIHKETQARVQEYKIEYAKRENASYKSAKKTKKK